MGTTAPTKALDIVGTAIVSSSIGVGTTAPLVPLQVEGITAILNGSLGVGTTTPSVALQVVGDSTITGTLVTSNLRVLGSNMTVNAYEINTSNVVIDNLGTGPALSVTQSETSTLSPVAEFLAGTTTALKIASTGFVGVATAAPSTPFQVQGIASVLNGSLGVGTDLPAQALQVIGSAVVSASIGVGTTAPLVPLQVQGIVSVLSGSLGVGTTAPAQAVDVTGSIVASASIGVGTTAPTQALQIQGSAIVSSSIGVGTASPTQALQILGSAIVSSSIGVGTASPTQALQIQGSAIVSSSIGIGTTAPTQALQVEGQAMITGLLTGSNIYASGPVCIGNASPTADLHVSSNVIIDNSVTVPIVNTTSLTATGAVTVGSIYVTSTEFVAPLQVQPLHSLTKVADPAGQSVFSTSSHGQYSVVASNTDVYYNGRKLGYYSPTMKDFDVSYSYDATASNTNFEVTLTTAASQNDVIDVTLWPTAGPIQSGQLYQSFGNPWSASSGQVSFAGAAQASTFNSASGPIAINGISGAWANVVAVAANETGTLAINANDGTNAALVFVIGQAAPAAISNTGLAVQYSGGYIQVRSASGSAFASATFSYMRMM